MIRDMPAPSVPSSDHVSQLGGSQRWLSSVSPKPVLDGAPAAQPQVSRQQDKASVVHGCWEHKLLAELQDVTMRSAETLCEVRAVRAAFGGMTHEMMSELRTIQQDITALASTVRENGIRDRVASHVVSGDQSALVAITNMEHRLETRLSSIQQMEGERFKSIEATLGSIQEMESAKFNPMEALNSGNRVSMVSKARLSMISFGSDESEITRNSFSQNDVKVSEWVEMAARLSHTPESRKRRQLSAGSDDLTEGFEERDDPHKPASLRGMPMTRQEQLSLIQVVSSVLVILNVCFMGFSTHVGIKHTLAGEDEPAYVLYGDLGFMVAFISEMVLRIWVERPRGFFLGPRASWNIFDLLVTTVSVLEVFANIIERVGNISWLRALRIIRVVRAVRIFRLLGQSHDVRFILDCIVRGFRPFITCLMVLFCCLYLVALAVTQSIDAHLDNNPALRSDPDLLNLYGSLGLCMFTLFKSISGGASWGELLMPLDKLSTWQFRMMYCLYMTIFFFGICPGLLVIFIGHINRMWSEHQDFRKCEEHEEANAAAEDLKQLLTWPEAKGMIARNKLTNILNGAGAPHLKKLGLELETVETLFKLLERAENKNKVCINELFCGLMELKRNPASFGVVATMCYSQRIMLQINALKAYTENQFSRIALEDLEVIKGKTSV